MQNRTLLVLVFVAALLLVVTHCAPTDLETTDGTSTLHTIKGVVNANRTDFGGEGIRIVVNGGEQVTFARFKDGAFTLQNLASGIHIVEAFHPKYVFPQIRLELTSKGKKKAILNDGSNRQLSFPITISSIGEPDYFHKKEHFDIIGIAKNPMVIFMVIGIAGAFLFPKLLDQESVKESIREAQESMRSTQQEQASQRSGRSSNN